MSAISTDMSLLSCICTQEMQDIANRENCPFDPIDQERKMIRVARLLTHLVERAMRSFLLKEMRKFDANPGDAGCQLQAFALLGLFQNERVMKKAQELYERIREVKVSLSKRNVRKDPSRDFFSRTFALFSISNELLYLIRTFLLTTTKVLDHIEENGVRVTRTDISKLSSISRTSDSINGGVRAHFVAKNAASLSRHSIALLQSCLTDQINPITRRMLSAENLYHATSRVGFPEKTFACLFFQIDAILTLLKERKAFCAIKTIEKEKQIPTHFFYQASREGFALIEEDSINPEDPLIVFEAVIPNHTKFFVLLEEISFEELLLICASQEAPFGAQTTIEVIRDGEAKTMIENFRKRARKHQLEKDHQPLFLLDHVFCNSMKEELGL